MTKIEQIPAELRWNIATRAATAMPFAYHRAVMERYGEGFEESIVAIWREAGKGQGALARGFAMPLKNAADVAEAYSTISTLLLGPELQGEVKVAKDRDCADIVVTSCPMCSRASEMGMDPRACCADCRAYGESAVESLNPSYGIAHRSGICVGDAECRMRIEPKA
ncbi:hypothetical protein [Methanofollis tationis]|uniref:L-2-amino-thiazoline-4-carboxylic acid hydrolase n=1 Tax=Methanofollis tationis TaxID=81417 RepID=A0A7K4HPT7_9EURY|nr:hypothetical protein [Methanofollis tationis]NVO67284.1 hypothetical protein [Methanofollis tationis]